jgi:hypothetical protein
MCNAMRTIEVPVLGFPELDVALQVSTTVHAGGADAESP